MNSPLQQFTDYVYFLPQSDSFESTLSLLRVEIKLMTEKELEFDLIGFRPYLVNAIRQTIINDVPTMAIEDVYFLKNSSIFNCDYVAQRLALIPIKAEPNYFKFLNRSDNQLNSDNTIIFNLNFSYNEQQQQQQNSTQPITVYSENLIWEPIGEMQKLMSPIKSLFNKIPLICLKQNEEISAKIVCIKGVGRTHMKFCPGLARYCFNSKIDITNPDAFIDPDMAHKLQKSFPPGVIELKPYGMQLIPYVANSRLDRHSRSFKNDEQIEKNISVKYYRDYMIFSVESYGVIEPKQIVTRALDILIYRYNLWKMSIEKAKTMNSTK